MKVANVFRHMALSLKENLAALARFVRTPTLARSVVALLSGAILLLLAVNLTTFAMMRQTAAFNREIEHGQSVRISAKDLLTRFVDAETGQRGFLLTGRRDYLAVHDEAIAEIPALFARLENLTRGDEDQSPRIDHVRALSTERLAIMERTIALAKTGRIGEAVQLARSGQGKALMDAMREEIAAIDEIEATRQTFRTRRSEWSGTMTVLANGIAGGLILVMAGVSLWLVRNYVRDIEAARRALDLANASLEDKVRARTGELTRANEEIQRFAYIVSHDLRSPLVNVMGYTSELEQAGKLLAQQLETVETKAPELIDDEARRAVGEEIPEAIGFIRASTAKMDRLINAILKLSREGRRMLTPEALNMTALARGIADSVSHQMTETGGRILVHDLPELESDRLSIEQILGNLIDNAVKYLEADRPGLVEIEGEDVAGGWVAYRVRDNGRGIAAKDHERVFELFRRSGRQDRPGEGLGLAFVRNSVRRLGGSIEIESEPGKGSTFHLKFPKRLILSETGDLV